MKDKTQEPMVKIPEWMFWPDRKWEIENRRFAERCHESMVRRLKQAEAKDNE